MEVFVDSIGLIAPGLAGWPQARRILSGNTPYVKQEIPILAPAILPPAERRRCIASARLALTAAVEALPAGGVERARPLACVFASSDGDGQTIRQITDSLAQEIPDVSPTRFANSVHNAAAGYWSIAQGLKQASTCLCAFDDSFAAGLLEAGVQVADEEVDALLTAFDMRFPSPFFELRPTAIDCAVALLLTAQPSANSIARLQISVIERHPANAMPAGLPEDFTRNPAARALPLLAALATLKATERQTVYLDYLDQSLALRVTAC
jgi:hypothetical protein